MNLDRDVDLRMAGDPWWLYADKEGGKPRFSIWTANGPGNRLRSCMDSCPQVQVGQTLLSGAHRYMRFLEFKYLCRNQV